MLRSSVRKIRSAARPRPSRAVPVKRIITSGPQTSAAGVARVDVGARYEVRHHAHAAAPAPERGPPSPPPARRSGRASARAPRGRAARPASVRRRGARRSRSAPGWPRGDRRPTAAARARCRRRPPARRGPRPAERPARPERPPHADAVALLRRTERDRDGAEAADREDERPGRVRSPLTEMGTSPLPNTYSMANCPGAKPGSSPSRSGVSSSVQVLSVSRVRPVTRNGTGTIGPRAGEGSAWEIAIEVEEPEPGRLQPLNDHRREASQSS